MGFLSRRSDDMLAIPRMSSGRTLGAVLTVRLRIGLATSRERYHSSVRVAG